MAGKRQSHSAAFQAQVALAALKGERTVNELAGQYGVHPTLIHGWKKHLLAGADQSWVTKALFWSRQWGPPHPACTVSPGWCRGPQCEARGQYEGAHAARRTWTW